MTYPFYYGLIYFFTYIINQKNESVFNIMSKQNITKKQHYVPQVYLRWWKTDSNTEKNKKNKDFIYQYDQINPDNNKIYPVPIKDVCQEDYLYEFRDKENKDNFINVNFYERCYKYFEDCFNKHLLALEKTVDLKKKLLHKEEIWWKAWICLQLVRTKRTLELACDIQNEMYGYTDKNEILSLVGPFMKSIQDGIKSEHDNFFYYICDKVVNLGIYLFIIDEHDEKHEFITSDNPVCISKELDIVIYPVTPKMCFGLKNKEYDSQDWIVPVIESEYNLLMNDIINNADRKLYSKHRLKKSEVKSFKNAEC